VLTGRPIEHASSAKQAVIEAAVRGLDLDRGAIELVSIDAVIPPQAGACPGQVAITLSSPLRRVEAGRLVGPA
jgi:hypothetical protein